MIEWKIKILYYFLTGLIFIEQIFQFVNTVAFNNNEHFNKIMEMVLFVKYCFIIVILTGLGTYLLRSLKKKYYFEY